MHPYLEAVKHTWRLYKRNKVSVAGLILIIFFVAVGIFGPLIAPYNVFETSTDALSPPSMKHLMGTDDIGRDTFSGVMHGASISLMVGVISAFIALIVGILLGAVSGYYGGKVDEALMRIADFFVVIPTTLLLIVIAAIFGPKLLMTAFIIGVLSFRITARVVRAEFLSWKEREFVESARLSGMSEWRIMLMEVLPNIMPLVIASATLQVAASMVFEASISFLGLGDPEFQSLGYMLYRSQLIYIRAWWTAAFPGLMLFLGALGINVAGEGLNEALNPRLRGR